MYNDFSKVHDVLPTKRVGDAKLQLFFYMTMNVLGKLILFYSPIGWSQHSWSDVLAATPSSRKTLG